MPRYVALLRGINLGGRNKIGMADLRDAVSSLGHQQVATYVQSGNVLFTAASRSLDTLADELEACVAARADIRPTVVVLTREQLANVVAQNPYQQELNPKSLHAVFHRAPLSEAAVAAVAVAERQAQQRGSKDEATVIGRVIYLHTPDGLGRSELAAELARSPSKARPAAGGTARNWRTVTTLLAMLDGS